jgi:predicted ATPase
LSVVEEAATDVIALWQARGVTEPWTHPSFIDAIAALQRRRQVRASAIYQKQVFFIQHLGFIMPTEARRISFEETLRFERVHEETYHNFGFECVPIAPGSLLDRVEAIKRSARSGQSGSLN